MRICWQSFIDAELNAPYIERLSVYLNAVASPGVTIDVWGLTPPDHDVSRLSEFRCSVLAVDNGMEAEASKYDAYVIGHFQDPGLFELRATLRIPVVGTGESTIFAALQLGRRIGLVSLHPNFETWHLEQADRYGIGGRIAGVTGIGCRPEDFARPSPATTRRTGGSKPRSSPAQSRWSMRARTSSFLLGCYLDCC